MDGACTRNDSISMPGIVGTELLICLTIGMSWGPFLKQLIVQFREYFSTVLHDGSRVDRKTILVRAPDGGEYAVAEWWMFRSPIWSKGLVSSLGYYVA
ncbi:MAG: hypothetical protein AAF483_08165 [Planctomycetota bacterium]